MKVESLQVHLRVRMERTIAYSMMALKMLKMQVTMYLKNTCPEKSNTKIHFNQTMFLLACIVNGPFKMG